MQDVKLVKFKYCLGINLTHMTGAELSLSDTFKRDRVILNAFSQPFDSTGRD